MHQFFLKNISILIVEDNEKDLDIIAKSLKRYFNKVYTATNGSEAYKVYEESDNIDLIISDIEMPKLNGLELLKMIRLKDAHIPFIIVSATFDQESLLEAINHNVSSFLPKPVNVQAILEKVDLLCESKFFEFKEKQKQHEINNYLDSVNSVALIYKMKGDGDIIDMNSSMMEISGYSQKELKALRFEDIIHPDIPKKYIDDTWEFVKSGKLWKGNTKFISKQKEVFYLNNTVFKLDSEEDTYITIAFLTTQENLEKRDFHKKVLNNIKEFNLKEQKYKKYIEELTSEIVKLSASKSTITELNSKIASLQSQIKNYEKQFDLKDKKYTKMLESKKDEIEIHINKAKKESEQNSKILEEKQKAQDELELLKKENKNIKEENINMQKHIKDLKDILKMEVEKRR